MFKRTLNILLPGGYCYQWTVPLPELSVCSSAVFHSAGLWMVTDADDMKRELPMTFELVLAELVMVILKSFNWRSNVIASRIWFECLLTVSNDSHFFIFIRCIAVCLVNDRSFMTFNCRTGTGPQSYRNRQQSVQAIMTAMWNDITAGVASTVTCLLHFLELGLELTHQGKSDLVKGDQCSY